MGRAIGALALAAAGGLLGPRPSHGAHDVREPPRGPAVFHISTQPPLELSPADRHSLQRSCIERLPGLVAQLGAKAAHAGDYEAHVHVLAAQPIVEHLERTPDAEATLTQAERIIEHGLGFWQSEKLARPVQFQFLVMTGPPGPAVHLAGYPADRRALIQIYRKRGQVLRGKIEILFEDHEPHVLDFEDEQVHAAQSSRNAQWGHDDKGRSVSRFTRTPIFWSVDKRPPIPALAGASVALEILRLQLSPYTDACKRRLFENDEKRHGAVDIHRVERPLWHLDAAENATVVAVGSVWLAAVAREHGHRLTRQELKSLVNVDAPGVAQILSQYPSTQQGTAQLLGAYTADPLAMVQRLGQVLDP